MKPRVIQKLIRYLHENDLPKFKSYSRKHQVALHAVRLQDAADATLLHECSRLGHEAIVRYLLKKGCDPLLQDGHGDLPVHLAAVFTKHSDKHGVSDLIQPLIEKHPGSLDIPNQTGQTAREILASIHGPVDGAASGSKTFGSVSEEEESAWKERLAQELQDDYTEELGHYEQDYYREEPVTFDGWASKMSREHHSRQQGAGAAPGACDNRRKHRHRATRWNSRDQLPDDPKKPRISAEKTAKFEANLKADSEKLKAKSKADKLRTARLAKDAYEKHCVALFSAENARKIQSQDVPWPHEKGQGLASVEEFLFADLERSSEEFKKYLKKQQVRWHPDRFLQKCGVRLCESQRDKILTKVKEISQLLNCLSED